MKIDLNYLKKNFNLDAFIKSLNLNYKHMDEGDMLDRVAEGAYQNILDDDGAEIMIWDVLDDPFCAEGSEWGKESSKVFNSCLNIRHKKLSMSE